MDILFIGAGKMATAIAKGAVRNQLFPQARFRACDPSEQARASFTAQTGLEALPEATPEAVSAADVLILAVKPQTAPVAFPALPPRKPGCLILSICAGLSLAKLRTWFGDARMVRVMPNTPLMVGMGASCYALSDDNDKDAGAFAETLLGALGKAWRVPEEQLDAVTALSGSGPAYFFAFIEALTKGGVAMGLPEELSQELSIQTMAGATAMLQQKTGTPAELRVAVTSKGGTTAAALDVMSARHFDDLVQELLLAAQHRSQELGR
jgi:pyrroline-5-carboxylate reductase